jgi:agmatine deiminase
MPAEWSPHQATWISWPHNPDTWPGVLAAARVAMAELVIALAPAETVHINVQNDAGADDVRRHLHGRVPAEGIAIERIPTNDAWIRDYGAIIVRDESAPDGFAAMDFGYNAWGCKYPPYDRDCAVARRMAEQLGLPRVESGLVLEGGSVDVNGEGLGLVTEQCLLNPNRNPDRTQAEIESILAGNLGLEALIWLGDGVVGDDTDGHIDNLTSFVAGDRVVTSVAEDPADPNHAPLAENLRRLRNWRGRDGRDLEIIELPTPAPVMHAGRRLPASHANFYIGNDVVLVPVYGGASDAAALGILSDCFPERRIQGIDCRSLAVGLGALHCLTQQVPAMVTGSRTQKS